MGIVVYFPAVAPPEAYAGLIDIERGSRVAVAAVIVDARKKFLRVDVFVAGRTSTPSSSTSRLLVLLESPDRCWIEMPATLLLFADTDTDDGDVCGEKPWMPAVTAVR
jgi:hypothetical protein